MTNQGDNALIALTYNSNPKMSIKLSIRYLSFKFRMHISDFCFFSTADVCVKHRMPIVNYFSTA